MKPSPLDYELAKLIDQQGIRAVLAALCREAGDRKMERLFRRLNAVYEWLGTPAGERDSPTTTSPLFAVMTDGK